MDLQEIVCSMYIIKHKLWGQKLKAKKLYFLLSIYAAESFSWQNAESSL